LQGYGVNMMTSYQMVKATLEDLKINARDFSSVKKVTDTFVEWANKKLDEVEEIELQVCDSLPQVRKKRKKRGNFCMKRLMIL